MTSFLRFNFIRQNYIKKVNEPVIFYKLNQKIISE